jgi:hypothetical protein
MGIIEPKPRRHVGLAARGALCLNGSKTFTTLDLWRVFFLMAVAVDQDNRVFPHYRGRDPGLRAGKKENKLACGCIPSDPGQLPHSGRNLWVTKEGLINTGILDSGRFNRRPRRQHGTEPSGGWYSESASISAAMPSFKRSV